MRPQPLEHNTADYERPNQPWVCGLAALGHACAAGPAAGGRCPALAECVPVRDGDRWRCNRAAVRGGPCETGPTADGACCCVPHCAPVRSLRAKRGRFIATCSLATAAVITLILSADWRNYIIAPGPLADQHAQLLRREGTPPQCGACHPAAGSGLAAWTVSLISTHNDDPSQSQLCLKCHARSIGEPLALLPHNVPTEFLDQLRQGDKETRRQGESDTSPVSLSPSLPVSLSSSIACSTCHREHHGANFDLTSIDNNACQTCHQTKFRSFAADHPDFAAWPYNRRTPIVFNHAAHVAKHFPDKKHAFDCRNCHSEDAHTGAQLTASYEATCAACHDEKIATSAARGVPMLVLPTLDVEALRKAGHDVGPWPKAATGDFDGRLPAVMKLLLAADPAAAKAFEKLGANFEFVDVDPGDNDQLAATVAIATAIKKLLTALEGEGPAAATKRLNTALKQVSPATASRDLFAGLSTDTLQSAARAWLPLDSNAKANVATEPVTARSSPGTWYYDDATLSIRYLPTGHADPVLTGWLTQLIAATDAERPSIAQAALKELSKPISPGLCVSCHSIEQNDVHVLTIHWRAANATAAPRSFTKFSHSPHLLLRELADCTACHKINDKAEPSQAYADWSPANFASEFKPLSKQECATCHTAKAAGDACQKCHNYHIETPAALTSALRTAKRAGEEYSLPSKNAKTSTDTPPAHR